MTIEITNEQDIVVYTFNSRTLEAKVGEPLWVLCNEFRAGLGYKVRSCLEK